MKNLPIQFRLGLCLLIIMLIWGAFSSLITPGVNLYNNTKTLELTYNRKVQEQITNYDGYYLAFTDKKQNANINKDIFIEVTSIIMKNRKDGENLAWKWVSENQQIPYSEFTIFYKDLSAFISERYFDNMKVEKEKQSIVQEHNTLLETFPNVFYNKIIGVRPLMYKFGYVSQHTKVTFK